MSDTTTRLLLPYILAAQAQKLLVMLPQSWEFGAPLPAAP